MTVSLFCCLIFDRMVLIMSTSTSWAERQKFIYIAGIVIALVLFLIVFLASKFWPAAATCVDGKRNQDEQGVDCGGACGTICHEQATSLTTDWVKTFEVREGWYSAVAYIENKNQAIIEKAPYEFIFYDSLGGEIDRRSGIAFIPPRQKFPVFEGRFQFDVDPSKVEFKFTEDNIHWYPVQEKERFVSVEDQTLVGSETSPRLWANLENSHYKDLEDIPVTTIIYTDGQPIAASQTYVENLPAKEKVRFTYTWPNAFPIPPRTCNKPIDVIVAIDRSGSMNDDQDSPPQPITDVLSSAGKFTELLSKDDRLAVVSFATEASLDTRLSESVEVARAAIRDTIILPPDEQGYTNLGDALKRAYEEYGRQGSKRTDRFVIALTDGLTNWPEDPDGETYALKQAELLRSEGVVVYTIGLGEKVNGDFLRSVATTNDHYFLSPTVEDLSSVYTEIGTTLCAQGPSTIQVQPLVRERYVRD